MTNPMPPGWYDDPDGSPNAQRRWDGHTWTPERRRKAAHPPPPPHPQPAPPPPYPTMPPPGYPQPGPPPPPHQAPPPGAEQTAPYPQPVPPQYPHAPYPGYPQAPHSPQGPAQLNQTAASNIFSIIAFVCAGLALLGGLAVFAPLSTIFGIAAIICALVALTKKERLAPIAIGALILGWILQATLWDSLFL